MNLIYNDVFVLSYWYFCCKSDYYVVEINSVGSRNITICKPHNRIKLQSMILTDMSIVVSYVPTALVSKQFGALPFVTQRGQRIGFIERCRLYVEHST